MTAPNAAVVPAEREHLDGMARLAAYLVRMHHAMDPARFMIHEPLEEGYRWWLGKELENPDAILLVSLDENGAVIGYAYGRMEERDWNALLDACGAIHDVVIDEHARRRGIGRALLEAMLARMKEKGAPRVVLHTASGNAAAQALFRELGFRPTMIEMTREL
jgi:ribosomal protein S18 acetylase RimI-like enzyme